MLASKLGSSDCAVCPRGHTVSAIALALVVVCVTLIVGCHGAGIPFSRTRVSPVVSDGTLIAVMKLTIQVDAATGLPSASDETTIVSDGWTWTCGPIQITETETTFTATQTCTFTNTETGQEVTKTISVTIRKPPASLPTGGG